MSMTRGGWAGRRPGRWAALVALSATLTATVRADDDAEEAARPPGPEAVLAGRGLRRAGDVYVLPAEAEARPRIVEAMANLRRLEQRAAPVRAEVVEGQGRLRREQQELAQAESRRDTLSGQVQYWSNASSSGQSPSQRAQVDRQLADAREQLRRAEDDVDRLRDSTRRTEARVRDRADELERLESEHRAVADDLEGRVAGLREAYAPLTEDAEVTAALMAINRKADPWVLLGPEPDYERTARAFAETVLTHAGLELRFDRVTKRTGRGVQRARAARLGLAGEQTIIDLAHRAWLLKQRLKGPEADARRAELAGLVSDLRRRVEGVESALRAAKSDPLIAAAMRRFGLSADRLAPRPEYLRAVKQLPELERAAGAETDAGAGAGQAPPGRRS